MARYRIADLSVEIPNDSAWLQRIAQDYRVDDDLPPDMTLSVDEAELDRHTALMPHIPQDVLKAHLYGVSFFRGQLAFDAFSFHASALMMDGGAYLFSAPSGTGKSTHARLWKQRFGERVSVLNDDKPTLRLTDNGCRVYGTPWCGKHQINTNDSADLKAIVFLKRGSDNRIRRLHGNDVIRAVLEQCLCDIRTSEQMVRLMNMLDRVLSDTPVYELVCTVDDAAAQLVYDTVQREEGRGK